MLARLGDVRTEDLTEISTHLVITVDQVGDIRSFYYRTLWRADADDVAYAPLGLDLDPVTDPLELTRVIGCRAEGPLNDRGGTTHGFRLVFDSPLRKGEQSILEVQGESAQGLGEPTVDHSMITGITELVIWVQFHPDRLPRRTEAWASREGTSRTQDVPVHEHGIHARVSHEPAGQAGVRWYW